MYEGAGLRTKRVGPSPSVEKATFTPSEVFV
jgi:hypothetical protein